MMNLWRRFITWLLWQCGKKAKRERVKVVV